MAIKIIGNINGEYKQRIVTNIYMTNSEDAVEGKAYKLSSQRWTEAKGTDRIYAVCIKSETAGTNVYGTMSLVRDGDILEADYTGTPAATFIPGQETATLGDADGSVVDASDVTNGHLVVLEVDTFHAKVYCIATKHFTQAS